MNLIYLAIFGTIIAFFIFGFSLIMSNSSVEKPVDLYNLSETDYQRMMSDDTTCLAVEIMDQYMYETDSLQTILWHCIVDGMTLQLTTDIHETYYHDPLRSLGKIGNPATILSQTDYENGAFLAFAPKDLPSETLSYRVYYLPADTTKSRSELPADYDKKVRLNYMFWSETDGLVRGGVMKNSTDYDGARVFYEGLFESLDDNVSVTYEELMTSAKQLNN